ncbi:MAG TPA: type II toxin-antitoxin system VapC family toxin [Microbacterium sp.]|nr:type II toxin-antitoxin system VapC family toxin [Microbacterium sp.]
MIGIDTNVLVRDAVQDDPIQSPQARDFLSQLSESEPGFVSIVTMIEAVWTLRRAYRIDRDGIFLFVSTLLSAREIVVQAPDVIRRAMNEARQADAEFADAVIALLGVDAECDYTVTFDRAAAELPGTKLLGQ